MAKKMDEMKKAKLVYSGELGFFAVAFTVLGILLLTNVLHPSNLILRQVFVYISLVGGTWVIADFIWCLASEKRRKKNSLLDKATLLPVAVSIIAIDIITLVKGFEETLEFHRIAVGILFLYIAVAYGFQAVYHYYHPLPMLIEAVEEEKAEQQKQEESQKEEAPAEPQEEAPAQKENPKEEEGE